MANVVHCSQIHAPDSQILVKHALSTGIAVSTGPDDSSLATLLLDQGYIAHGIKRRASSFNTSRINHPLPAYR